MSCRTSKQTLEKSVVWTVAIIFGPLHVQLPCLIQCESLKWQRSHHAICSWRGQAATNDTIELRNEQTFIIVTERPFSHGICLNTLECIKTKDYRLLAAHAFKTFVEVLRRGLSSTIILLEGIWAGTIFYQLGDFGLQTVNIAATRGIQVDQFIDHEWRG